VIGTLTITAGENLIFYDLNFGISERPHQQDVPGLTRPEKPMTELRVRRYAIVERCSSSMIKTPTLSTTRVRKNLNQRPIHQYERRYFPSSSLRIFKTNSPVAGILL